MTRVTDSKTEAEKPDAAPARRKATLWEEVKGLLVLLLVVFGIHSLVAKPFYIPSSSMMPNLLVGDQLIVSKWPYGWSWVSLSFHLAPEGRWRLFGSTPERGDIVILTPPGENVDFIKRVIGLPGDTIAMRDGLVLLNGRPVRQEVQPQRELPIDPNNRCREAEFPGALRRDADGTLHCMVNIVRETLPNGVSYDTIDSRLQDYDNLEPVVIPADHVFLLGDNRDNSADSRFAQPLGLGGPVPLANVGGRAEFITLSFDGSATWNPLSWFRSLRSGRAFDTLRPDQGKAEAAAPAATQ